MELYYRLSLQLGSGALLQASPSARQWSSTTGFPFSQAVELYYRLSLQSGSGALLQAFPSARQWSSTTGFPFSQAVELYYRFFLQPVNGTTINFLFSQSAELYYRLSLQPGNGNWWCPSEWEVLQDQGPYMVKGCPPLSHVQTWWYPDLTGRTGQLPSTASSAGWPIAHVETEIDAVWWEVLKLGLVLFPCVCLIHRCDGFLVIQCTKEWLSSRH